MQRSRCRSLATTRAKQATTRCRLASRPWPPTRGAKPHIVNTTSTHTHHHGGARHLGGEFGFERVDRESHWKKKRCWWERSKKQRGVRPATWMRVGSVVHTQRLTPGSPGREAARKERKESELCECGVRRVVSERAQRKKQLPQSKEKAPSSKPR